MGGALTGVCLVGAGGRRRDWRVGAFPATGTFAELSAAFGRDVRNAPRVPSSLASSATAGDIDGVAFWAGFCALNDGALKTTARAVTTAKDVHVDFISNSSKLSSARHCYRCSIRSSKTIGLPPAAATGTFTAPKGSPAESVLVSVTVEFILFLPRKAVSSNCSVLLRG